MLLCVVDITRPSIQEKYHGQWWRSCGQHAHRLLRRFEFESCLSQLTVLFLLMLFETTKLNEIGRLLKLSIEAQ